MPGSVTNTECKKRGGSKRRRSDAVRDKITNWWRGGKEEFHESKNTLGIIREQLFLHITRTQPVLKFNEKHNCKVRHPVYTLDIFSHEMIVVASLCVDARVVPNLVGNKNMGKRRPLVHVSKGQSNLHEFVSQCKYRNCIVCSNYL